MAMINFDAVKTQYEKAKEYELQAQAAQAQAQLDALNANRAGIGTAYDEAANKVYTNARLTSRGRAENLAAMGLGRGYYDDPTSGYGERAISRADTELRDNLAGVETDRAAKYSELETAIANAKAADQASRFNIESTYAQRQAALAQAEEEARANYALQLQQIAAAARSGSSAGTPSTTTVDSNDIVSGIVGNKDALQNAVNKAIVNVKGSRGFLAIEDLRTVFDNVTNYTDPAEKEMKWAELLAKMGVSNAVLEKYRDYMSLPPEMRGYYFNG